MLHEVLKKFALAKAPENARPLTCVGPCEYWGTNLSLILGVESEIQNILDRGDSQIKNIPLKFDDGFSAWKAWSYLHGLVENKPHAEYDIDALPIFLQTVRKLKDVYYLPKLQAVDDELKRRVVESDRLQARYDFLISAAQKDPSAINRLHDEFYPDACWNPEAEEAIPAPADRYVRSLAREKQQRIFKEALRQEFRSDFVQNRIFPVQAMLGIPDCLDSSTGIRTLNYMGERNRGVMVALDEIVGVLARIVTPQTPVPMRARIVGG